MKHKKRMLALLVTTLVLTACSPGGAATNQAGTTTTSVRKGTLTMTVSSSGTVEPARTADLSFAATGTVNEVLVDEGQQVTQGQALASIDPRDLDQRVIQAEANLKTAQAQLTQAKSGNATEADLVQQQAALRATQAQLQLARTGGTTAADIASQQAAVRSAQAGLTKAQTGNVTAADIAEAEASIRAAEANLAKTRKGTATPADIANAEAAVRSAEAQLRAVQQTVTPDKVSAAQTQLAQAQQSLQKTQAQAATTKASAYESQLQAADTVRLRQEAYSTAYWNNQQAQNGTNPQTGGSFESENLDEGVQQRQYAEALRQAELQLRQTESQLEQSKVAYENAKQAEINDVATAQALVDDAQVQLNELLKGPKDTDVAQAQAALDQARANLQKLNQGGSSEDIAAAQADLDRARAGLQKLRAGGTAADIAQARASLDQAQAQLRKLQQGGTAADVANSQAQVDQAQAQLEKLSAGASPTDIEIADANVLQAESQLKAAQLERDKATITAPFNGTITTVNIAAGGSSSGATTSGSAGAFTIVDPSTLHLDVNVSESDVAQIQEGQSAQVTIDALGSDVMTGTVRYIAPAATTEDNVTTYLVRVALPQENKRVRVGMTASVKIQTQEKTDVLVVPSSAVRRENGKRIVRKQQGEQFVDTEVRVGLVNERETEIVSGLSEGDVIAQLATVSTPGQ